MRANEMGVGVHRGGRNNVDGDVGKGGERV